MKTHIIEATNGPQNWGKFMLGYFDEFEWQRESEVSVGLQVIPNRGWTRNTVFVMDLQTGEGALFTPPGLAKADLDKHQIWVCPLFEPFLEWLYTQPQPLIFHTLVHHIDLPDAKFAFAGYRRPGPDRNRDK